MADNREPPPLFDDDDHSRKDQENDDLFSSAVQSPVNGQDISAAKVASSKSSARDTIATNSSNTNASLAKSSDSNPPLAVSHPMFDPLQSPDPTPAVAGATNTPPGVANTVSADDCSLASKTSAAAMLEPATLTEAAEPTTTATMSVEDGFMEENGGQPSSLDTSAITNLPPVPSNMYSIVAVDEPCNSMDLFESCVEDAAGLVKPFAAVSLSQPQEVSLDDDNGLFTGGVLDNARKNKTGSMATTGVNNAASTLPTMGAPITPPTVSPLPPAAATTGPPSSTAASFCNNYGTAFAGDTNANTTGGGVPQGLTTPPMPAALQQQQLPAAGFYNPVQHSTLDTFSSSNANDGEFIEVLISEPQKVGDGMGSYMAYKMTTRTNINFFKKQCWSVTRRFSDYLGLHAKLVEKHLHAGRIIPPAPEKDALNTTKLRLSSGEGADVAAEFLERRRASLQRYMQRTAALPHLRTDPDFREFIELDTDLPRATQTSAMSGAGVMRLFNKVGESVNKFTFKMEESDKWFEDRVQQVESLESELRRLHAALEGLAGGRRELAVSSSSLSKAAAVLSSVEEHSSLSRALHQLAEATDRTQTVYHAQADADFYILCETTRDYINLIGAVKEVFHERVKVFQAWQYSQTMLSKKRDAKAKLELTARQDKVHVAQQEVVEWEGKVERNQDHFERISQAIKKELEQFDVVRVQDFKSMLIRYLEAMVTSQQQVINVWETFLPEAKAIS